MNRDEFEGKWKQFKGKVREKWGKLTNDDLEVINGKYDQFIGRLQQRYGYSKEKAEQELQAWKYENRGGEQNYGNQNRDRNEGAQQHQRGPENRQNPSKQHQGNFGNQQDNPQDKNKFDDRKDKKRKAG